MRMYCVSVCVAIHLLAIGCNDAENGQGTKSSGPDSSVTPLDMGTHQHTYKSIDDEEKRQVERTLLRLVDALQMLMRENGNCRWTTDLDSVIEAGLMTETELKSYDGDKREYSYVVCENVSGLGPIAIVVDPAAMASVANVRVVIYLKPDLLDNTSTCAVLSNGYIGWIPASGVQRRIKIYNDMINTVKSLGQEPFPERERP